MTSPASLASRGLSTPDYGGREIGAVMPAAVAALGCGEAVAGRDAEADRLRLGVPEADHVVVVLLDGLGELNLTERRGHAPFLRGHLGDPLTAGYPTTTASSLALLGTGQAVGRTGMSGYTARNPRTGSLANLISWEGADDPVQWQQQPSVLEQAASRGIPVLTLGRPTFAGSGLTLAALRGGAFHGVSSLPEAVDAALVAARQRGLTYLYWGQIDAAGHHHGWGSTEWAAAVEHADGELARLARSLPAGALMVATADHGMVDVDLAHRWDVAKDRVLADGVALVAGEPRALHLHVESGADATVVAARWQDYLSLHAVVWTREQAIDGGLFGPVEGHIGQRLGDVVVAMAGRASVVDSRTQTPKSLRLIGVHGSLTPHELTVPWVMVGGL